MLRREEISFRRIGDQDIRQDTAFAAIEGARGPRSCTHSIQDHTPAHEAWRGFSQTLLLGHGPAGAERFQAADTQAVLLQPAGQSQRRELLGGHQTQVDALRLTSFDKEIRHRAGRRGAGRRSRSGRRTGSLQPGPNLPGSRRCPRTYQNNGSVILHLHRFAAQTASRGHFYPCPRPAAAARFIVHTGFSVLLFSVSVPERPARPPNREASVHGFQAARIYRDFF